MNKVDVIVDGRPVAGMYQVVHHRIETISTTNAVVPRAVIDVETGQVGKFFDFLGFFKNMFWVWWEMLVCIHNAKINVA